MKPTDVLKEEHRGIELMMDILEAILQRMEKNENPDLGHLGRILEFFQVFADKCHHGKEEDLLFPSLEAAGVPREGGPVAVMLSEHEHGRAFIRGMKAGIEQMKSGNPDDSSVFRENAWNYIMLLRQHIDKEENILFRIADAHIPHERQEELLEEFEKIETEKIGPGKHEEYHRLLHEFKGLYINEVNVS